MNGNNENGRKVSESTISRSFIYLRELTLLSNMNISTISSFELGERLGLSDAQVRKDFGYFGNFGVSGAGYDIESLKKALKKVLGKETVWNVGVIGVGHLGAALLSYSEFDTLGLHIVAAFDNDPEKIGQDFKGIKVKPISELSGEVKKENISIGVVAVTTEAAQSVVDDLIASGVECIMNFAPVNLIVPPNIRLKNVDLSRELEIFSFYLTEKQKKS